jgi:hypothetical protein
MLRLDRPSIQRCLCRIEISLSIYIRNPSNNSIWPHVQRSETKLIFHSGAEILHSSPSSCQRLQLIVVLKINQQPSPILQLHSQPRPIPQFEIRHTPANKRVRITKIILLRETPEPINKQIRAIASIDKFLDQLPRSHTPRIRLDDRNLRALPFEHPGAGWVAFGGVCVQQSEVG